MPRKHTAGTANFSPEILAPLSGLIVALDELPDDVFARRLVGDGVAIDPTSNEVLAPVGGRISQLHRAHHALAITDDSGVEILIHVGLDTVKLEGHGFTPLVALDQRFERGQALLRFDADDIACRGYSLLTPVVVTSGVASVEHACGLVEAGRTPLLRLTPRATTTIAAAASPGTALLSEPISIANPAGLHARPAAVLAECARRFQAGVRLRHGATVANAKSVVAIMGLSTRAGDQVRIEADGPDAAAAVSALSALLAKGSGEDTHEARPPVAKAEISAAPGELSGVAASPGIAIGRVHQYRRVIPKFSELGAGVDSERARLREALRAAGLQLAALERGIADPSRAQLLAMQRALLEDPELWSQANELLERGKSAGCAWQAAIEAQAAALDTLAVPLLRERAADVRDVGQRVLLLLSAAPGSEAMPSFPPEGAVIIAEELSPAELAVFEQHLPGQLDQPRGDLCARPRPARHLRPRRGRTGAARRPTGRAGRDAWSPAGEPGRTRLESGTRTHGARAGPA